jgi:hypothetical protein
MPSEPRVTDPAAFDRAVRALDWRVLGKQVTRYAVYRCKGREMARDLAAEAIRRVLDPATTLWDPATTPNPARLLMSVVNGLLRNEVTSARARRTVGMTVRARSGDEANDEVVRERVLVDPRPLPDEALADADLYARRLALLRERLAHQERALRVLDWMLGGHETPAALGAVSGWSPETVVAARRMVQRHAAEVARDLPDDVPEAAPADAGADDEEEVA